MPTGDASTVPVLLCIDVEPDDFFLDDRRRAPWLGFERAVELFHHMRDTLPGREGQPARFTWTVRMDPQVAEVYGEPDWTVATYPRQFELLQHAGDELGLHPHAYRSNPADGTWTLDYADQHWVEHCVRSSVDAFAKSMGRPCRTFRMGDRWMNQPTARLIARLGGIYNLSLEPGGAGGDFGHHAGRIAGALPDLRDLPRRPYHPTTDDYRIAATGGTTWMIPVTTARVRPTLPRRLGYAMLRHGRHPDVSTLLLSHEPRLFSRILDRALDGSTTPHLAMAMRCTAAALPRLVRRVRANLDTLRRHPLARRFAWVTPEEAAGMFASTAAG